MAHGKPDYYAILGVARDADDATIKAAFRKLAREHHPDRNRDAGAEDRFKEVNEAYAVLSDPDKRRAYDLGDQLGGGFGGFGGGGGGFGGFGSFFDEIFGRGGGQRRPSGPRPGRNAVVEIEVPLETIFAGGKHDVHLRREEECHTCGGNGAAPGTSPVTCDECGGAGQKVVRRRQGSVVFQQVSPCDRCGGSGHMVKDPCPSCDGSGTEESDQEITVTIPIGIDDGTALRVPGLGEASPDKGGIPGDLHVVVRGHDERFERRGQHLIVREEVSVVDAALGAKRKLQTPCGTVSLEIPAGVQPGHTIKLTREGLPGLHGRGGRGDLYVAVEVKVPEKLSREQKKLYEQLRKLEK
ncbi:MAG: DnaJ domain-containing protein [Myxococcales bacterium]|nr:DnaJ domain-containing protein [Myxococcales bacterium]MCB9732763.1 DnaJ domain-containing protein [Deltaproteobacteria bacterium]